ncbi:MAG: NUDIX hydrolase [Patescibacteria group bacterium]
MQIDKPAVAMKAVFLAPDNTVLMLREAATNPDGTNVGKLHIPGGRIAWGETVEEGLRREVQEETSIDISGLPVELFAHSEWRPVIRGEQWQIIALFFLIRVSEKPMVTVSLEHDAVEWVSVLGYREHAGLTEDEYSVFEALQKKI